jgi:glycolate oxidase iron-sulfur subunit
VALGKKSGLSDVARALGLLRVLGKDVARAEGIVSRFPDRALRDEIRPGVLAGKGESLRIGYFVGCGIDLVSPQAGRASIEALRAVARSVEVLDNCCCGLPAVTYGDPAAARRLVRRNLELLEGNGFDVIATDCSSCASFLKKWPVLLAESDSERRAARDVAARVKDMVEILHQKGMKGNGAAKPGRPLAVTYHDPCHARRGQKIGREPREILRALPGIDYRELPESDWCCGGAGAYALAHYDLSRKVLDRKIDNVEKTGAEVVATSCPACMIHLSYGVRTRGLNVKVRHISEMV